MTEEPRRTSGARGRRDGNRRRRLPGDPTDAQRIARMIRVDQAGEFGAKRIYEGQLAVLGDTKAAPVLQHMADQEREHLDTFNRLVGDRQVRPSALYPVWHVAGFALGAGTALLGEKAAMACTVAVEEAIDEHYAAQRDSLPDEEEELREIIERFRLEELEHRDTGLAHGAAEAPAYRLLSAAIKSGTRAAIWMAERI